MKGIIKQKGEVCDNNSSDDDGDMNAFDDECDDTYSDNDDHEAQDDDNSVNNVDGYNSDGHSTITLQFYLCSYTMDIDIFIYLFTN